METTIEYRHKTENKTYYFKNIRNVQRNGNTVLFLHEGINLTINIKDVIYLKLNYLEVTHD